jgi:hypothetical protein
MRLRLRASAGASSTPAMRLITRAVTIVRLIRIPN